ncbi:ABC transporter permease [Candidatus Saccharibacteria bacterium]|nr:ABC transporter permease [Candidatus Saccharibacteria bacterium]
MMDTWAITKRNLLRYIRLPQLLFFSSIQPVIFLTLFNFVFGGALGQNSPYGAYINYLLPGIMIQTTLFGSLNTGIGLAEDMGKGIIDRFRSLPLSRAAVMAGRTMSDMLRNVVVMAIMFIVGTIYGFRFMNGFLPAIMMFVTALIFSFSISWVAAFVGLTVKDSETAQLAGFVFIFPLTFASSAFVPVQYMPGWLQAFANNQPVTHAVNAARSFALGSPMNSAFWYLLAWVAGILLIFVPLSIWRYRKS